MTNFLCFAGQNTAIPEGVTGRVTIPFYRADRRRDGPGPGAGSGERPGAGDADPGGNYRAGHVARRGVHVGPERPEGRGGVGGVRVVAAYPGGSPDLPASRDRVAGFTRTLRDEYRVEIVDSIDALIGKVDVVLLESVDGRTHSGRRAGVQGGEAGVYR